MVVALAFCRPRFVGFPGGCARRSREAVEAQFCASGGMPMTVGDGPYADSQCWCLEGGDQDFALETGCGMPEQCSSEENAEDVLSQAGESMSGTIGAAWQQK